MNWNRWVTILSHICWMATRIFPLFPNGQLSRQALEAQIICLKQIQKINLILVDLVK